MTRAQLVHHLLDEARTCNIKAQADLGRLEENTPDDKAQALVSSALDHIRALERVAAECARLLDGHHLDTLTTYSFESHG